MFTQWITRAILSRRYESSSMLDVYIAAQYGPFLQQPQYISEPFYQKLLLIAKEFIRPDTRCLDVGCATGRLVFEFARFGAKSSIGVDTSKNFIGVCNTIQENAFPMIRYAVPAADIRFIQADITTSPLEAGSFEFISCINVIDRVKDPFSLIAQIKDLLSPGGILLLCDPLDWALSPAPKKLQFSDMKEYLSRQTWNTEQDIKNLSYEMTGGSKSPIKYECQVIVVSKPQ